MVVAQPLIATASAVSSSGYHRRMLSVSNISIVLPLSGSTAHTCLEDRRHVRVADLLLATGDDALRPRVEARRQRAVEADALNGSTRRAPDDHDSTDAVRPRRPMGDQHGEKHSRDEQKDQHPDGQLHLRVMPSSW